MKVFFYSLLLVLFSSPLLKAATFTASASGDWTVGTTWGGACTTGCTAGTDYPGTSDDAIVPNGFSVTVTGFETCRNILLDPTTVGALNLSLPFSTLTVEGTLIGYSNALGYPSPPSVSGVISGTGTFTFTGTDINGYAAFGITSEVIAYWNSTAEIPKANFNFGDGVTQSIDLIYSASFTTASLAFTTTVNVNSGTLQTGANNVITGVAITNGTLTVASGATLKLSVPLTEDGTSSSRINTLTINGTIEGADGDSYINAETLNLNSGGALITNFSGSDQTDGWWYNGDSPSTLSIDANSTISYTASADQAVFANDIGNLFLGGSGSKSLTSSGTLKAVDLTINTNSVTFVTSTNTQPIDITGNVDNDGTWEPTQLIRFNGSSAQIIGGNNMIVFGNGVEIGDNVDFPTSDVSLNQSIDINGNLDIRANATLTASNLDIFISGDWNNDGTFDGGTGMVTFDGTSEILGSTTTNFHDITISGTLTGPTSLVLEGNWVNNGTFTEGAGTVTFSGTTTQDVSGTTTFNNIQADNSVDISGTANLGGILTLGASVTFDADGSGAGVFTLASSASSDACIAEIPSTSSVSGNLTVQRYMDGEGRLWRYLSSPVTNATVADWQDDFSITGSFTGADEIDGVTSSASLYYYNETASGDITQGWVGTEYPVSANTETLNAGTGYAAYIREETDPTTIDVTGPVNQGTFNFGVTYTNSGSADDGWNLIGNPYPCPINWDDADWTKTNIGGTVYIRDNGGGGVYATWNGTTGTNGGTGNIATGQSFWVQTTATSPNLEMTEGVKTSTATTFFRTEAPTDLLRIALSDDTYSDDIVIHFREDATESYDVEVDAKKLYNERIFNLSSIIESGEEAAINSLPELTCGKEVNLNIQNIDPGTYELAFSNLTSFGNLDKVQLVDAYENTITDLSSDGTFTFEVSSDEASYGSDRFKVVFITDDFMPEITQLAENILSSNFEEGNQWYFNDAPIEGATEKTLDYTEIGTYKLEVQQGACISYATYENEAPTNQMVIRLVEGEESDEAIVHFKEGATDGFDEQMDVYNTEQKGQLNLSTLLDDGLQVVTNILAPLTCSKELMLNVGSMNPGTYELEFNQTDSFDDLESLYLLDNYTGNQIEIFEGTRYIFVVTDAPTSYGDERFTMTFKTSSAIAPEIIDLGNNTLQSNYETGNQWYFNGELISGKTAQVIKITESGTYTLEVTGEGCEGATSREMVITGLGKNLEEINLDVYPNPVQDYVNINFPAENAVSQNINVNLIDVKGNNLSGGQLILNGGSWTGGFNLVNYPNGVYFIKISDGENSYLRKIILEHK